MNATPKFNRPFDYTITFINFFILFFGVLYNPKQIQAVTNVNCSTNFPCQPELIPKIEFWIRIFQEFGKRQAVFHDAESPEVIYSVITSDSSCGLSRRNGPIELERERIKKLLRSLQSKSQDVQPNYTPEELTILDQTKTSTTFELDKSADRIRCQNGIREQFEQALSRYRYYKNDVVKIITDSSLPDDIQYLPFVESSYNPMAYSKVGAAGLWQIMPQTARVLGLKINSSIDERLDPIQATKAAARYFVNSYQTLYQTAQENRHDTSLLGPFVITSYNYGIAGMKKALEAHGANFTDVLNNYKGKSFRVAVKNFYASFLAARHLVTNEPLYFQNIQAYRFPEYKVMSVPKSISAPKFSEIFNIPDELLRELNPVLTKRVWTGVHPIPQYFELKVPNNVVPEEISKTISSLAPEKIEVRIRNYKVQRGDTPCAVASMFQISCKDLMLANALNEKRNFIRVGQTLSIPSKPSKEPSTVAMVEKKTEVIPPVEQAATPSTPSSSPSKSILILDETPNQISPEAVMATTPDSDHWLVSKTDASTPKYYVRVESEETLGHYSDWIPGATTQDIRNLNNISFGKSLTIGQKIYLPIKSDEEKASFEKNRIEYHQTLEEGFEGQYNVIAFTTYKVKSGDTEWTISNDLQLPMWLLKKYNADLLKKALHAGDTLTVPILKEKAQTEVVEVPPPLPVGPTITN